MIHVATDGGTKPNPGSAGWGALIRQNGCCTYNGEHYDHPTNNLMELMAVIEAMRIIPEQMHLWVMTDSAYVKNGITQWLPIWIRNGWKNPQKARAANKSLWESLIAMVKKMKRVEWSWVKAHNGTLLNECADMLATKGVMNEPRQCPIESGWVLGEDADSEIYVMQDGEDTPLIDGKDSIIPEGRTFVMKDGNRFPHAQYLLESEAEPEVSEFPEPNFDEITRAPVMQWPSAEPSEPEESDTQSHPPESEDEDPRWFPCICFQVTCCPYEGRRPDWWSAAWEKSNGHMANGSTPLMPVSPCDFKESVESDVCMVDQIGHQHKTDPITGEEICPDSDPELITMVAGCVWNSQYATFIKRGAKGGDPNTLILDQLEMAVKLIPAGKVMRYDARSEWLVQQWRDMLHWKELDYKGLDRDVYMPSGRES
jgi:ribonuclease HI